MMAILPPGYITDEGYYNPYAQAVDISKRARAVGLASALAECPDDVEPAAVREIAAEIVSLLDQ